jgi:hypothetical protein
MQLDQIRKEIERMRTQVQRQRGEIRQLQRAGISTTSAEALLERMLNGIDRLCAERDRLKEQPGPSCTSRGRCVLTRAKSTSPSNINRITPVPGQAGQTSGQKRPRPGHRVKPFAEPRETFRISHEPWTMTPGRP